MVICEICRESAGHFIQDGKMKCGFCVDIDRIESDKERRKEALRRLEREQKAKEND